MNGTMESPERTIRLCERAKSGDPGAFETLTNESLSRLRASVETWSKFRLGPAIDVEDVLQETFLRASRSMTRFEWQGDDAFFRWLCGIAKRALTQAIQDERRRMTSGSHPSIADSKPNQASVSRRTERFERLDSALRKLKPEYREVLVLSRIEGLKTKDIARRLDRSPNSIKHLMARALNELRSVFGDTESLHLPSDRHLGRMEDHHEE